MVFEGYQNLRLYSGQTKITLPKSSPDGLQGKGNVVFLVTPSLEKSIEFLKDPSIAFTASLYKYFSTDSMYKSKIGNKNVISNDRNKIRKMFEAEKGLKVEYKAENNLTSVLESQKNLIYDLSRWAELFFVYRKSQNTKQMCESFFELLFGRMNDSRFASYNKLMLIDLNSWCTSSACVIMNRRLLNNPLSIIFYTAFYYPDIIQKYPDIRIMVLNRSANQVFFMNLHEIDRKSYTKIKSKIKAMKDFVVSADDETEVTDITDEEIQAVLVEDNKENMKKELKDNLLGKDKYPKTPFNEMPEDAEPFDITDELEDEDSDTEEDDEDADPLDELINAEVEKTAAENPEDFIYEDSSELADNASDDLSDKVFVQSFIPERTPAELEKIKRLTDQQNSVIPPTKEEAIKNSIETTTLGPNIVNSNPNIMKSRFVNFDKAYVEKCMESDIDNSVKALSNASSKIFIVDKKVEDTSDPMNLKKTYTYSLKDEKGNPMTVKFDIPVILDGTYIFINGSKKIIGHQFVLKPIVKTSPDAVQIVTAYNKVFIYRKGEVDKNTAILQYYISKNRNKFSVVDGNFATINNESEFDCPLDFIMMSRYFAEFKIKNLHFMTNLNALIKYADKKNPKHRVPDPAKEIPIAFDEATNELIILPLTVSYTDFIYAQFAEEDLKAMRRVKRKPKLIVASAKIMKKFIPIIVFAMFCEGFSSVMRKANVEYRFYNLGEDKQIDPLTWDYVYLDDCILAWKQKDAATAMLMNGLKLCAVEFLKKDDLESQDAMLSLAMSFYNNDARIGYALANYRDFLLDEKAKEMLSHFGYPTDLVSLLIVAVRMLCDNKFKPENNMENMRVRSTEVISDIIYKLLTDAYTDYRKTSYKKKPTKIAIPQSKVIDSLLASSTTVKAGRQSIATNLVAEFSTLNPVLELEKARAVTFKGIRGIQLDKALTVKRRAYDESMLGNVGISTSPDANVGVVRELTLEPNITSTRGYMEVKNKAGVEDLNSANLFTAAELLTPIGVTHDDPDRTAMSYKQTKYMVSVADSDPVLIGNRVEAMTPYILSDEFVVDAKEDGEVIDITTDWVVVKYKSGKTYAIDIAPRVKKNASAGFYVDNTLRCDLKLGEKFKKGDVLAYNDKQFTKHLDDKGASMNLGVLTKVAISSSWDIYEDSTPITTSLSERLATEMIDEKAVVLDPDTIVDFIAKVGDKVTSGDTLLRFSGATSEEMQNLFDSMRDNDSFGDIVEDAKTTIKAKHTGELVDIKIYTTVPISDLDPSLAKIVTSYQKKINARNKVLDKYANPGDLKYYKAGQVITEVAEVMEPSKNGKIRGEYIDKGVVVFFYVKYRDVAAKGDLPRVFSNECVLQFKCR